MMAFIKAETWCTKCCLTIKIWFANDSVCVILFHLKWLFIARLCTINDGLQSFHEAFGSTVKQLSCHLWLTVVPDLKPLNFFIQCFQNCNVFREKPHTAEEMKEKVNIFQHTPLKIVAFICDKFINDCDVT